MIMVYGLTIFYKELGMQSEAVCSGLGVKSFIYRWNLKKLKDKL